MKKLILVTGGNGFLATHIIKELLTHGYAVRATLRSLSKATPVKRALTHHHVPHLDALSFVVANLTQDADWAAAMTGVDAVMSVAAPVFVNGESVDGKISHAAQVGVQRILRAATTAGVNRVIMTGNLGAVGFSNFSRTKPVTPTDWTDPAQPGLSPYEKSKLLAEQAAWQFVKTHPQAPQLVTVNAGAMLGPSLSDHVSGSFGILTRLIDGKPTPNLTINVVDVRDVAHMHVLALQTPNAAGHRFIAVAPTPIDMRTVIQLIKTTQPTLALKLPRHLLPTTLIHLLAPFNAEVRTANLMLKLNHHVSTQSATTFLNWHAQYSSTQAVVAALDSLANR
ncbi:MAG: NAD-dependent epimerase/dehydratase family protein [Levilactobacillus sp.]|uniref:NAD-dependent epimerase/dehydratase family protein n=1 Tax=Levilactobacillus suantsaiihabitans TaxID=2487722 RepID=A0A4Z0JEC0_9LACO|nr:MULTISPECIES: NAD-dependent epimerase/dehydratase family protein [Levilactobacillus]MCI1553409.1 NAD-dependent epimerase/dehydratase family protein [Levilactobacillus sp.]MCI1599056.1 NAD-dependent epimerase/dehydratase family protein [Levilactobacillus sp.]MCI1605594.1 NAD-dependent epimerase/dehydratase family protein [Levilactobacillus sp.]TGD19753.1 NAD-dependent epimerase/dehydratase family protein [Levilactobacillus suantsaiihabitans]